jgi:acyl carrier protein
LISINLWLKPQDGMVTFVSLNSINNTREVVIKILTKVLNSSDTALQSNKSNPSWDSLKQLQISLELEDYFGIQLSDEEAIEFYDVESIVSLVESILKNEG